MISRAIFTVATIFLTLIYAFGSGLWVNTGSAFYQSLKRPSWQPPDFIFGLIWPYNFFIIVFVSVVYIGLGTHREKIIWLTVYLLSVVAALLWACTFYINENLLLAAIFLFMTALFTIPMTYLTWKFSYLGGILFLPYQIWLFTASSLSIGFYILNNN